MDRQREKDIRDRKASQDRVDLQIADTDRQIKETDLQIKETDLQIKETDRQIKKTGRQIKETNQQLGGMANSDGDEAEELFSTSLESKMMFAGQHYDAIDFKVRRKVGGLRGEFDIVLYNGTAVAIIEVKSKACQADVEKLVNKQVEHFRTLFPLYKDHKVYLGLGSMSFDDRVLSKAHELGVGILRQKGNTIEADTSYIRAY
jgi:Holliday junction resolvase-like predicted endonuclease